ncbi:MAG: glycosyltransferase family 39 protein [Anaerolineae bacterium]|jgi:4-amino-4-deoxy-L-arabinose transferase-like glycosyltransferase
MTAQRANRQRPLTAGFLVLIMLLAFGLRFYHLGAQSLWNDEGTSVALAQRDLVSMTQDAARDIHPPLYYWLLGGWVRLFGTGEAAVRSLSALLGGVLVALTFALGRLLAGRWTGLVAALLAAVNPFQVYYAQEARMYMLLAVLTAGSMLALVLLVDRARPALPAFVALALLEAAGLYTHYSFAFVVAVLNLAYLLWLALTWRAAASRGVPARQLAHWLIAQAAVLLLYLPWLPTALRQVTAWPSPAQSTPFLTALATTWRWLVFGPTIETDGVIVPLVVAALLAAAGLLSLAMGWIGKGALRTRWFAAWLALWLGLPIFSILGLGLYREAYLKFLLVVTPAAGLLMACGLLVPQPGPRQGSQLRLYVLRTVQLALALLLLVPSVRALGNYYTDPAYARDGYRSIAGYIEAIGRPGDAILLNAPGQQEVFGYYYGGDLPVYPLPESRPLDPASTEAALIELAHPGGRVFAVLWATDESDPERFIEGWLDSNAYKALDSWYGNVRLVVYAVPEEAPQAADRQLDTPLQNPENGDTIALLGYSLLGDRLAAGDIAQITLFWKADRTPVRRYKVFLHLLDKGNHIVGQRDAEPGGGARLTDRWAPGEVVIDNYGLPIHPATPPGEYRLEVGMYDAETGQRLLAPGDEAQVWLEPVTVERPTSPAPIAALGMHHAAGAEFGTLALLGYDLYKLGFAHQPDAPLRPGDVVHVNLYWQAQADPRGDWQVTIAWVGPDGRDLVSVVTQPVGAYPTSLWQAGDVWRGQFDLALPNDAPLGWHWLRVEPIAPDGTTGDLFISEPLEVGQ